MGQSELASRPKIGGQAVRFTLPRFRPVGDYKVLIAAISVCSCSNNVMPFRTATECASHKWMATEYARTSNITTTNAPRIAYARGSTMPNKSSVRIAELTNTAMETRTKSSSLRRANIISIVLNATRSFSTFVTDCFHSVNELSALFRFLLAAVIRVCGCRSRFRNLVWDH
jgi:hypothetical protein